ncbi:MAG: ABC transporter permease [Chloroflexota bacterium]|nr:ABC transporter permease [Chloroflexota bacterium]
MILDYLFDNWPQVLDLALDHLELASLAVGLALLLAMPLGIVASRIQGLTLPVLGILGALYTVPSLAFLAFLIPSLGLGRRPAIVMLAVYAQIFLVRNIIAGLRGVDAPTIEAARGVGMTDWQVFHRVRWPLALPIVIAGMRTALVTTISLATVSAWINAGGLGTLLFTGISRDNPPQILAGAIAIVALTLLADAAMRLVERGTAVSRAGRAARRV